MRHPHHQIHLKPISGQVDIPVQNHQTLLDLSGTTAQEGTIDAASQLLTILNIVLVNKVVQLLLPQGRPLAIELHMSQTFCLELLSQSQQPGTQTVTKITAACDLSSSGNAFMDKSAVVE